MSLAIITGSSGLIGSETVKFLHSKGFDVVGIDNNMRKYFFGPDGTTRWKTKQLTDSLNRFYHHDCDIRNQEAINKIFAKYGSRVEMIVHCAAQPSHDWAAREPLTDFNINATATLILLEATRKYCPEASFIFTSTNKVYGDSPNSLPLLEQETRWEINPEHQFYEFGIDESMTIDRSRHSIFGASKVAADIMVQEYGRYFNLNTAAFRGGCLTGPAHSGAELHGFLSYLVKCAITEKAYTIHGYKGKQVRDNIHSEDLVSCFWEFHKNPKSGVVYNMGGSRHSNCSILEAIDIIEEIYGKRVKFSISDQPRIGDHIWYISDVRTFQQDYPNWKYRYNLKDILRQIIEASEERYGKS